MATRVQHMRTVRPQTHVCASPVSAHVLILSPQCTCTEVIAHVTAVTAKFDSNSELLHIITDGARYTEHTAVVQSNRKGNEN